MENSSNFDGYQPPETGQTFDGQLDEQNQEEFRPLKKCVKTLLQIEATSPIVKGLIRSIASSLPSSIDQHDDNMFNSTTTTNLTTSLFDSTTASSQLSSDSDATIIQNDTFLANINWYELSKRLPADESPFGLELLSERWQFYLEIIYSLTAVTSFILNVITVIVLIKSRRSELRKYLINLSLSDLLMSLFSIPFTYTEYMLGRWIFPGPLCPNVHFVVTLSVFVSVATMTVIGVNRHLAIMYPLKRRKYSNFQRWSIRKTHVILGIWVLGIGISLPEFLMFSAEPFCHNNQLFYTCRHTWPDSLSNFYTIFIYCSTFVIPLSLLSYLYTSIGLKLWRRQMPGNVDVNRDLTMQTKRAKVIKMLLVVVLLFAVFWLPLQTFSMVMFLYPDLRKDFEYQSVKYNIFIGTYFTCHWFAMAHSCLNPLIYCFMNDKFRTDLHALLCVERLRKQMNLMGNSSANNYSICRLANYNSSKIQHSTNGNGYASTGSGNNAANNRHISSKITANNHHDANAAAMARQKFQDFDTGPRLINQGLSKPLMCVSIDNNKTTAILTNSITTLDNMNNTSILDTRPGNEGAAADEQATFKHNSARNSKSISENPSSDSLAVHFKCHRSHDNNNNNNNNNQSTASITSTNPTRDKHSAPGAGSGCVTAESSWRDRVQIEHRLASDSARQSPSNGRRQEQDKSITFEHIVRDCLQRSSSKESNAITNV